MNKVTRPNNRTIADIKIFLLLQGLTIPIVMSLFHWIEPRILAAMLAGMWFCCTSAFMVFRSARWPKRGSSPIFWMSLLFSVGVAFPMLTVRALNWSISFDQLSVWGIPGPLFHRGSNIVFMLLVIATVYEFLQQKKLANKKN